MAFQIYQAGDEHEIRGIKCNLMNVASIAAMNGMLNQGWYSLPEEIENGVQRPEEAQENDPEEEASEDEKEDAEKVLNPLRIQARDANIEGWDTKRLTTLETLLTES